MVGLLLQSLFCLDIDSEVMHDYLREVFPGCFEGAAHAKTSKGHHYVWRRSDFCDGVDLTDCARLLQPGRFPLHLLDVHGEVPVDVKTITSTGTSGVLVVPPSPNKAWLTAPWEVESDPCVQESNLSNSELTEPMGRTEGGGQTGLSPVPDEIVQWICKNSKPSVNRRRCGGARNGMGGSGTHGGPDLDTDMPGQDPNGSITDQLFDVRWDVGIDLLTAIKLAKELLLDFGDHHGKFYKQENNGLYFKSGPSRVCPYFIRSGAARQGHYHDSNSFKLNFIRSGAIKYWCFGSSCQDEYRRQPEEVGRWMALALEAGGSHFNLDHYNSLEAKWREERQVEKATRRMAKRLSNGNLEHDPAEVHDPAEEMGEGDTGHDPAQMGKGNKVHDPAELHDLRGRLIRYLNRFFVAVKNRRPEIMELKYDEVGRHVIDFTRRPLNQHWAFHRNMKFMQNQWLCTEDRRTADRLVFEVDPAMVSPREFNMFLGLRIEREYDVAGKELDEGLIAPILELLRDVWAEGNAVVYKYLLNWMAYPLKVKRKTGVCVVVISDQGYGKGTIAHDLLGERIYGEVTNDGQGGCYAQITDIDHIVGRFNTPSCMRLFINADECSSFGGAYKQNKKFKNFITGTTRSMEAKGLDPVTISDFANVLMTSNNYDIVKVEISDRRFVILDLVNADKKPCDFFNGVHELIKGEGALHFYKYLLARDLEGFEPQDHRPVTPAARRMMASQVPLPVQFIQECAVDEHPFAPEPDRWTGQTTITSASLFSAFRAWADKNEFRDAPDSRHFAHPLTRHGLVRPNTDGDRRLLELPAPGEVIRRLKKKSLFFD